jgi:hypothetical protein
MGTLAVTRNIDEHNLAIRGVCALSHLLRDLYEFIVKDRKDLVDVLVISVEASSGPITHYFSRSRLDWLQPLKSINWTVCHNSFCAEDLVRGTRREFRLMQRRLWPSMRNGFGGSTMFQRPTCLNALFMMRTGTITAAVPFPFLRSQVLCRLPSDIVWRECAEFVGPLFYSIFE